MTVIAWDGRTLAADRLAVFGSMCHEAQKIFTHDGVIYGMAGNFNQALLFKKWVIDTGLDIKNLPGPNGVLDNLNVIEICDGELFDRDGDQLAVRVPLTGADIWALGSGREIAMGAMLAGKDARVAVSLVCAQDIYCDCMGKGPEFLIAPLKEED